jgi:hypothetical protein
MIFSSKVFRQYHSWYKIFKNEAGELEEKDGELLSEAF